MREIRRDLQRVQRPREAFRSDAAGLGPASAAALLAAVTVLILPLLEPAPLLRALPAPEGLELRILAAGSCRPGAVPRGEPSAPARTGRAAACPAGGPPGR